VKKVFGILGAVIFSLSACASAAVNEQDSIGEHRESGHWIAGTQDNLLAVIGVANRRLRREDEIAAAKDDAARKVAMFHGMSGIVESVIRTDGGVLAFAADSRFIFEPVIEYRQFIEYLQFDPDTDVSVVDGGTLVRFRYRAQVTPVNFSGIEEADGRPRWVSGQGLPESDGYVAAVGISQNQLRLSDTVMRSVEAAAAKIIEGGATSVQGEVTETVIGTAVSITARSEGFLDGFRVLAFWINPENGFVYTLGIARLVE